MQRPIMHIFVAAYQVPLKYGHLKFIVLLVKLWKVRRMSEAKVFLLITVLPRSKFDHCIFFPVPFVDQKHALFLFLEPVHGTCPDVRR